MHKHSEWRPAREPAHHSLRSRSRCNLRHCKGSLWRIRALFIRWKSLPHKLGITISSNLIIIRKKLITILRKPKRAQPLHLWLLACFSHFSRFPARESGISGRAAVTDTQPRRQAYTAANLNVGLLLSCRKTPGCLLMFYISKLDSLWMAGQLLTAGLAPRDPWQTLRSSSLLPDIAAAKPLHPHPRESQDASGWKVPPWVNWSKLPAQAGPCHRISSGQLQNSSSEGGSTASLGIPLQCAVTSQETSSSPRSAATSCAAPSARCRENTRTAVETPGVCPCFSRRISLVPPLFFGISIPRVAVPQDAPFSSGAARAAPPRPRC